MLASPVTAPARGSATLAVLVLNFNGRALLEDCLPSVLAAAQASRHACRVIVVDNESNDDSREFLAAAFPRVEIARQPNHGLSSFNDVLQTLDAPIAVLLNNDIRLDADALDPLVAPLLDSLSTGDTAHEHAAPRCFMTAPRCWLFDRTTHEGFQTAVAWRWGLVQATAHFPGHEGLAAQPGLTASAGAALAVDRQLFLELGGFDPLYLPGRIEDLDFAFRGYLAGHVARYVPDAVAYHRGMASFGPAFSAAGCDHLALRNTILFQWKNLRHPWHITRHVAGLTARVLRDVVKAPFIRQELRFATIRALAAAWGRRKLIRPAPHRPGATAQELAFFREFHPAALRQTALRPAAPQPIRVAADGIALREDDRPSCLDVALLAGKGETVSPAAAHNARHPISRWYLLPLADWAAIALAKTNVRPVQVTIAGAALAAAGALLMSLGWGTMAAMFVLAAWFCDRLDGRLARRQQTESAWGAWLDANLDELVDLGLHAALAFAAVGASGSSLPWAFFTAFVCGKYLFIHGVQSDPASQLGNRFAQPQAVDAANPQLSRLRRLYHLPGNADVRVHLLALLTAAGWWTLELLIVAAYFNVRWIARYALVARRERTRVQPAPNPSVAQPNFAKPRHTAKASQQA